jgi:hypothetical protein
VCTACLQYIRLLCSRRSRFITKLFTDSVSAEEVRHHRMRCKNNHEGPVGKDMVVVVVILLNLLS